MNELLDLAIAARAAWDRDHVVPMTVIIGIANECDRRGLHWAAACLRHGIVIGTVREQWAVDLHAALIVLHPAAAHDLVRLAETVRTTPDRLQRARLLDVCSRLAERVLRDEGHHHLFAAWCGAAHGV